jgi:hypothetical protein
MIRSLFKPDTTFWTSVVRPLFANWSTPHFQPIMETWSGPHSQPIMETIWRPDPHPIFRPFNGDHMEAWSTPHFQPDTTYTNLQSKSVLISYCPCHQQPLAISPANVTPSITAKLHCAPKESQSSQQPGNLNHLFWSLVTAVNLNKMIGETRSR